MGVGVIVYVGVIVLLIVGVIVCVGVWVIVLLIVGVHRGDMQYGLGSGLDDGMSRLLMLPVLDFLASVLAIPLLVLLLLIVLSVCFMKLAAMVVVGG